MNNTNSNGSPPPGNFHEPPQRRPTNLFNVLLVTFFITMVFNLLFSSYSAGRNTMVSYNQFLQLVDQSLVAEVAIEDEQIQFVLAESAAPEAVEAILYPDGAPAKVGRQSGIYYTGLIDDPGLSDMLLAAGVTYYRTPPESTPLLSVVLSWVFPVVLMVLIYSLLFRTLAKRMGGGGGMMGGMGGGKSNAKVFEAEASTGITFADVAGQDEAKESLEELVDYLHNPEKYAAIGARQPKGALLVGPPGTGKTLLAKAVAGEAKAPFFSISGSEFVEMFVGMGAKRVRDLFQEANKKAPCIIFIDEIDAIGKSRDNQLGGNDEREQTLNQLLAEMDGFDSSKGIIVLAATNRPEVLDKALLRPGRFDRQVIVEKPDLPGRESILQVHSKKVQLGPDVDLHEVALSTPGATGADLANMINEAALRAVRMNHSAISQGDLLEAVEVVIAGKEKKDRILSPKEKRLVAYHETGHALVSALEKNAMPVQKITIVPRTMGSLGYVMNTPEEERYLMTRDELLAQIRMLLGGRAAEQVMFGERTTGASNDIERATALARSMITQYGMSERFGPIGLESTQNRYLDGRNVATGSEQTMAAVDQEVVKLLDQCLKDACQLLEQNKPALVAIAEHLIATENITGPQFMSLLQEHTEAPPSPGGDA